MKTLFALVFRAVVALLPAAWLRAALTRAFPLRVINGEAGPYLYRWTLREREDGGHVYLHFFARGDEDRALHDHPWRGRSLVLAWGYREERRFTSIKDEDTELVVRERDFGFLDKNYINADTFHRVDVLRPDRGCWTLFETSPYQKSWSFWDRETGEMTPWRRYLAARNIPVDGGTRTPRNW